MKDPQLKYDSLPWYRYPWPWVLIAIPFSAVLFGIVMIYSTGIYRDDLVTDSYYKDGMAINRTLEKDAKAQSLGIIANLAVTNDQPLALTVTGAGDSVIELQLFHVNDSSLDMSVLMHPDKEPGPGNTLRYTGTSNAVSQALINPGIWYLQLQGVDAGWRLRERIETPATALSLSAVAISEAEKSRQ